MDPALGYQGDPALVRLDLDLPRPGQDLRIAGGDAEARMNFSDQPHRVVNVFTPSKRSCCSITSGIMSEVISP
jgi:hypothetical protein